MVDGHAYPLKMIRNITAFFFFRREYVMENRERESSIHKRPMQMTRCREYRLAPQTSKKKKGKGRNMPFCTTHLIFFVCFCHVARLSAQRLRREISGPGPFNVRKVNVFLSLPPVFLKAERVGRRSFETIEFPDRECCKSSCHLILETGSRNVENNEYV